MLKTLAAVAGALVAGLLAIPIVTGGDAPVTGACTFGLADSTSPIEAVLATIRQVESGGRYDGPPNTGGASGAYQYIDRTWRTWAARAAIDTFRYPHAYLAPALLQDTVAAINVRSILEEHHEVAAVPIAWYWPRALDHPDDLDIVPAPQAGNRLTVREYQQHWLSIYERHLIAAREPPPSDPSTTSSETTSAGAACSFDPDTPADIQAVLAFALAQLGKPYVFGTDGPDTYDCSGLTKAAYHTIDIELPHYTGAQVTRGRPIDWHTEPIRPGDLIFIRGGSPSEDYGHVGIALDTERWINAPHTGDVVKIVTIPPRDRIQAVRRLVEPQSAS